MNGSEDWDQEETSLKQPYFIATTPRSGSTLLAFALSNQGLGVPLEYYNLHNNSRMQKFCYRILEGKNIVFSETEARFSIAEYSLELLKKRTTPNGVFGCKIFSHHHRPWLGDNFTLERHLFPNAKYIWLERRDVIAQAISYYYASQTKQWSSFQEKAPPKKVNYNFEDILAVFRHLKKDIKYWQDFFKSHPELETLTLYYDDLANDYENTIRRTNHFLGFEGLDIPKESVRKQESPLKAEFKKRFIQDVRKNRISQ